MKASLAAITSIILLISVSSARASLTNTQVVLSGKIVSSRDLSPVKGALVAVEGIVDVDEVGVHDYVRTDRNGRFEAKTWGNVVLRVWKPGYALRDIHVGTAHDLVGRDISIELRKLQSTNSVPAAINREGMRINEGFSFRSGKVVGADSPEADIKILEDKVETGLFLVALGNGGVCFQAFSAGSDFYNTPEAPQDCYSRKTRIMSEPQGIYYVRTRDGHHYAKACLIRGVRQTEQREDRSVYWLQWAYQPDGTRNLEIAIGNEYGFPFEKFGLTRESLK